MGSVLEHNVLNKPRAAFEMAVRERRILCAHPREDGQQALQAAFRDHTTVFVTTAYDTLRHFNGSAFDAIVLDYWLPDWSGASLCRDIRRSDPNVPICVYSYASGDSPKQRALRAKASSYLHAPLSVSALKHHISELMDAADAKSMRAASGQAQALHEKLGRYSAMSPAGTPSASIEGVMRFKAQKLFIERGGTRANFERWWAHAYSSARVSFSVEKMVRPDR